MVFGHKEIAKPFLEAVLGIRIHELKDPEPEKTIDVSPFYKGIRYDVFVKETSPDGEVLRSFDIEMQMEDNEDIPKRTRYYQAMCDSEALNKGEVYYKLKDLYIMFLCPEDIFGQGKAVYRFKNLEVDNPKIELGDLSFKNFFFLFQIRCGSEMPNMFGASLALQNLLYSISTTTSPRNQSERIWSTLPPRSQSLRKPKTSTGW